VLFGGGGGLVITGVAAIVKLTAVDVVPQGLGFTTVIEAVPAVAIREAGTVAVSCVEETNVVISAVVFPFVQFTVEVEPKLVPFTVNVKSGPPIAAQFGLIELMVGVPLIVNVTAFDVAPQVPGFTTVTEAVPGLAMLAFGTVAVSRVEELNVVVSDVPFHFTVEPETKFVPVTIKVKPALPAVAQAGLSEVIVGAALTVNVCAVDVPPPGVGFTTVTDAVPAVTTREDGTVAVSCVEETNVVVSAVPFQFTVEPETKFVPVAVKVKPALPAVAQAGLSELMVGTGLLMVMTSVAVPVPPPLVALMVTLYVPAVVGVPEITPVEVLIDSPGANPAAL
jgi:hypothetical protein